MHPAAYSVPKVKPGCAIYRTLTANPGRPAEPAASERRHASHMTRPEPFALAVRSALRPAAMTGINVGYARCSTDEQDLTAQRHQLTALGVPETQTYVDQQRPDRRERGAARLRQALAAIRTRPLVCLSPAFFRRTERVRSDGRRSGGRRPGAGVPVRSGGAERMDLWGSGAGERVHPGGWAGFIGPVAVEGSL